MVTFIAKSRTLRDARRALIAGPADFAKPRSGRAQGRGRAPVERRFLRDFQRFASIRGGKLYRPLNRRALRSCDLAGRVLPETPSSETPRAGSAMFGRGGKKTRTRIEPRLDWRGAARGGRSARRSRRPPADRPPARPAKAPRGRRRRRRQRRRSWLGRLVYWGVRARASGALIATAGARRLLREPAAADRPARGAQAPAQHRHPRRRRLAHRQSRRHRRRGGAA